MFEAGIGGGPPRTLVPLICAPSIRAFSRPLLSGYREDAIASKFIVRSSGAGPEMEKAKKDLVALLYYMLGSSYRKKAVVEAYCPELIIPRRFTTDPRDEEIIKNGVKSPVEVGSSTNWFSMRCTSPRDAVGVAV